jgi:hypothetical protein
MAKDELEVTVDDKAMRELSRAIRQEVDGKQIRKDLIADLRQAVGPGVAAVQGKLRALPHSGTTPSSPALGSYLASRTKVQVKLSGRAPGVKVRIAQTPKLRGFAKAARHLNRAKWRHPVPQPKRKEGTPAGDVVWVDQDSPMPGYFDDTLAADRPKYRAAVIDVLQKVAKRLTARRYGG